MPEYKKMPPSEPSKEYHDVSEPSESLRESSETPSTKAQFENGATPRKQETKKTCTVTCSDDSSGKSDDTSAKRSEGSNLSKRLKRPIDLAAPPSVSPISEIGQIEGPFTEKLSGNISSRRGANPLPREETASVYADSSEGSESAADEERQNSHSGRRLRSPEGSSQHHSRSQRSDEEPGTGVKEHSDSPSGSRRDVRTRRRPTSASSLASSLPSAHHTAQKPPHNFFKRLLQTLGLSSNRSARSGESCRDAQADTRTPLKSRRAAKRSESGKDDTLVHNRPPKLRRPPSRNGERSRRGSSSAPRSRSRNQRKPH